jgi:FkbM family methyltransferase
MLRFDRPPLPAHELGGLVSLLEAPLVALDVGGRDGVRESWRALGPNALLVGFDPDPEECARLNARAAGPTPERYEPLAVGASAGEATLNLTRDPQSSSLYAPNPDMVRRYPELWRHEPRGTTTVELTTVDEWAARAGVAAIGALKVDVQGAELDVLRGAGTLLPGMCIVEAEVEFQELYSGQPLFCDLASHLGAAGFELWRLRELVHCALEPAQRGEPVFTLGDYVERTRLGGQLAWGNAIFVRRDLIDAGALGWQERVRGACVAAIFDLPELVEANLKGALATAPASLREPIEKALGASRASGRRRRIADLLRRAPSHLRGFAGARLSRR